MADEPEEVHMGLGRKTKTSKYEDAIEKIEQEQFKRVQMTKKEVRAIRSKREEEMQDRLENLDDDFKAVENILRHQGGKSQQESGGYERKASSSKFAKSLKQYSAKNQQKYPQGGKSSERPRD